MRVLHFVTEMQWKKIRVLHKKNIGRFIWWVEDQSNLLCQMTANACKVPVITGPQEATVYGNLGMQLIAEQEVKDVKELRRLTQNFRRS